MQWNHAPPSLKSGVRMKDEQNIKPAVVVTKTGANLMKNLFQVQITLEKSSRFLPTFYHMIRRRLLRTKAGVVFAIALTATIHLMPLGKKRNYKPLCRTAFLYQPITHIYHNIKNALSAFLRHSTRKTDLFPVRTPEKRPC